MALRRCYVPPALASSVAQALRDSGRLALQDSSKWLLEGKCDAYRVRVARDGRIELDQTPACQALVTQCIKGVLPRASAAFLVGVDESGMGGEATHPMAAVVMMAPEVRADLIVAGVADSKRVGNDRLESLANVVEEHAMHTEVVPIEEPPKGQSRASEVAKAVGSCIRRWHDEGALPADVSIVIDQTDEATLKQFLGDLWPVLKEKVSIEQQADARHVEVAAASILARNALTPKKKTSAKKSPTTGHFRIGAHKDSDRDQIIGYLHGLVNSYPDIGKWIGKMGEPKGIWGRIQEGKLHLTVARLDNEVVGFGLTQDKDPRNSKISTFFVAPPYRRQHIGHRLLRNELKRLADQKTRRVMVTFGHEEFDNMHRFFHDHGFTVDGISPQRYRDNSYEVIMGKRLRHEPVYLRGFPLFVEHDVFRMQGFDIEALDDASFLATPRQTLLHGPSAVANRLLVHITTSPTPESKAQEVKALAKKHGATPVLASAYGFPADKDLPPGLEVLDALHLERMFYPMQLERPDSKDLVIPIRPEFVRQLFPQPQQSTLAIQKIGLRTTNVYYRVAKGHAGLRRGARLFFYESEGGRGIFGYGRLERIDVGSPKRLHGLHGGLGAWTADRIAEHTGGREGAAYRFSAFQELVKPVGLQQLQALHSRFTPQTIYKIPRSIGDIILTKGGLT